MLLQDPCSRFIDPFEASTGKVFPKLLYSSFYSSSSSSSSSEHTLLDLCVKEESIPMTNNFL